MNRPIRVLISKIGLDGHDRGAKLIVRNLRDAGMEVIYTGLWQTPLSTVNAAMQEDVDVLGVSLLSAAHMTIMPDLVRLCSEFGIPDLPVVVGGIIPERDHKALLESGLKGVFTPGTPMVEIIDSIRRIAQERRGRLAVPGGTPNIRTTTGLARALTLIADENTGPLGAVPDAAPAAIRIGVTGAPGVGKSTFIGGLARAMRARRHRVAVIAVDPSSPITGGSVLGDRLRMMGSEPDDGLFIRSLASSGQSGGLAPHCDEYIRLVAAAGFDVVLVETVGAGQSDVDVRTVVDRVLLLVMPAAGDAVQFTKAGIVEIAHAFVVHKADLPGADKTFRELRESLDDERPVWPVSSLRGEGLDPVCEWIEAQRPA
jgi:LAO/AO transport system ATPase